MAQQEQKEKLGESLILRCSKRGEGLYLFLKKDVVEYYDLRPGDKMKVKFLEVLRGPRDTTN